MTDLPNGSSYVFRVRAEYQNGFTEYSANSELVWACLPPRNLDALRLVSVSKTHMTLAWSQPKFASSCNLVGFAVYMNDGQGSEVLTEIDSLQIRD